MRRGLIEGGFESTAVKSGAINQLEALLSKLLFVLQTRGLGYRCILTRHSSESRVCCAVSQCKHPDSAVRSSRVTSWHTTLYTCFGFLMSLTNKKRHTFSHDIEVLQTMCQCVRVVHLKGRHKGKTRKGFSNYKDVLGLLQTSLSWDSFSSFPFCTFPLGVPHAHNDCSVPCYTFVPWWISLP